MLFCLELNKYDVLLTLACLSSTLFNGQSYCIQESVNNRKNEVHEGKMDATT